MEPRRYGLGIGLIVGSVFLMSFGDALIKHESASFTAWQIFTLRSLIVLPLLVLIMRLRARGQSVLQRSLGWVGLRSALLTLMWIAYYTALPLISLSAAAVAFYTAPLFIALLARLVLGEAVSPTRWLGIVLGFGGVLIVLRPGHRFLRLLLCRLRRALELPGLRRTARRPRRGRHGPDRAGRGSGCRCPVWDCRCTKPARPCFRGRGVAMKEPMHALERMLAQDRVVLLDGATGTELQRRGAAMDDGAWCALATASHPELLRAIHEDYVRAGCDVVTPIL